MSCTVSWESTPEGSEVQVYKTSWFNVGMSRAINSSVLVECYKKGEYIGKGAGNYMYSGPYKFVLTANHVIQHCDKVRVVSNQQDAVETINMYQDFENDIAIIKPLEEISNVFPAPYKLNTKDHPIGTDIYMMAPMMVSVWQFSKFFQSKQLTSCEFI